MEIHHQHHHDHPQHKEKMWKHYALEFFMLFLAVFCGFLAENFREQRVDAASENKYMASLLEDLKNDTIELDGEIPFWEGLMKKIDTTQNEIEKPPAERNVLLLYKCAAYMRAYSNFRYHDRTIEELKNGGNFKLIRNRQVSDSLIEYDARIKSTLRDQESQSNDIYRTVNYLQDKFLNAKYFALLAINPHELDSLFKLNPDKFSVAANSENELFEYSNHLQFYYVLTYYRIRSLKHLQQRATNLIALIKQEYHLE
jgi:hypothetical protein